MRIFLLAMLAGAAVAVGFAFTSGRAADPGRPATASPVAATPVPPPAVPARLVAHEWGTFTSFSGSDGIPVGFTPSNTDLPPFVYYPYIPNSKVGRLQYGGLVSMETPVIYFYTDKETKLAVNVEFPKGWITEWYPFAHGTPGRTAKSDKGGQSIRWQVKLTPDEPNPRFPFNKNDSKNHYYAARETDATPLQVELPPRTRAHRNLDDEDDYTIDESRLRGGSVLQREKFLFYRGVGTFSPPVTVKALGGEKVCVMNSSGGKAAGLVLVTVREGKIGFRSLGELENGATTEAQLPATDGTRAELGAFLVKELTTAGLYEKEAQAMVKTWDSAWFGEEGSRLLYLVPRTRTDELLPLTMDPKPTELVRVLVGRHDFLTPEQEAVAERELLRVQAAQKELNAAYAELQKLGRFRNEAQQMATKRLEARPGQK
jgi:hypothetical protein